MKSRINHVEVIHLKRVLKLSLVLLFMISGCTGVRKKEKLPSLEPDHYLYEVKDASGKHLYLLGTMHVGPQKVEVDGALLEAYEQSEKIVFEILFDFSEQDNLAMKEAMRNNPINQVIENDSAMNEVWNNLVEAYHLPNSAQYYNASYTLSLVNQEIMKELGLYNNFGIDMTLYEKAKRDKKKREAIEGMTLQSEVLSEMSEKASRLILISCLDKEKNVSAMREMVLAYANGELKVEAFDEKEIDRNQIPQEYWNEDLEAELEAYKEILVSSRNVGMFDKAEAYLAEDGVLLAVGAAHVLGESGLITQFQEAGYEVVRLGE